MGAVTRPKRAMISLIKLEMVCDRYPRCLWHESQIIDAGCLPLPGPINALVRPHLHGVGKCSVSPTIVPDVVSVLFAHASAVACAALARRVIWECKVGYLRLPVRSQRPGGFFVELATSGRFRTREYNAPDGIHSGQTIFLLQSRFPEHPLKCRPRHPQYLTEA